MLWWRDLWKIKSRYWANSRHLLTPTSFINSIRETRTDLFPKFYLSCCHAEKLQGVGRYMHQWRWIKSTVAPQCSIITETKPYKTQMLKKKLWFFFLDASLQKTVRRFSSRRNVGHMNATSVLCVRNCGYCSLWTYYTRTVYKSAVCVFLLSSVHSCMVQNFFLH